MNKLKIDYIKNKTIIKADIRFTTTPTAYVREYPKVGRSLLSCSVIAPREGVLVRDPATHPSIIGD